LPLGTIAAQVAHAAGSGSERHPENTYVVVLAAASEKHLRELSEKLKVHDVSHTPVVECDEPYGGQMMSVGLELCTDRSGPQKVLSSLPLLKEENT